MKKLLILLAFIGSTYASSYIGGAMSNDNITGINTYTGKLYLSTNFTDDVIFNENIKYYGDDRNLTQSNQVFDSNSMLTIKNGGIFTTLGYRFYKQPFGVNDFKDRQELTNGYASKLNEELSQSTFLSLFRFSDNSYKIALENDLHYTLNGLWSIDTNLSVYRFAKTAIIDDSYTVDGLIRLNYNITQSMSIYVSQEMVKNLDTSSIYNTTELGIGYLF